MLIRNDNGFIEVIDFTNSPTRDVGKKLYMYPSKSGPWLINYPKLFEILSTYGCVYELKLGTVDIGLGDVAVEYATVKYFSRVAADMAIKNLDGKVVHNRVLHVQTATRSEDTVERKNTNYLTSLALVGYYLGPTALSCEIVGMSKSPVKLKIKQRDMPEPFEISVEPWWQVSSLMQLVEEKTGVEVHRQELRFMNKLLSKDDPLSSSGLHPSFFCMDVSVDLQVKNENYENCEGILSDSEVLPVPNTGWWCQVLLRFRNGVTVDGSSFCEELSSGEANQALSQIAYSRAVQHAFSKLRILLSYREDTLLHSAIVATEECYNPRMKLVERGEWYNRYQQADDSCVDNDCIDGALPESN